MTSSDSEIEMIGINGKISDSFQYHPVYILIIS